MRLYVHDDRPRRDHPPRRPPPPRAPRARGVPRRPRGLRPGAEVDGARARQPLLVPPPGARALGRRGAVPEDCGGAGPEVPRDRGGAPARSAMPFVRRRAREGHHARERGRGPPPVLRPLEPRRRLRRRVHPPGRERSPARLPREAGAGRRRGRDDFERPSRGAGRPVRVARTSGARNCPRRTERRRRHPSGRRCQAARVRPRPSGREAARRGARPREHDGLPPPPRQARRRPRRPLALAPGRVGGGDPRDRPRPHPPAPREAPRDRREAACEGSEAAAATPATPPPPRSGAATSPPRSGAGSGSATAGAARGRSRAAESAAPRIRWSSITSTASRSARAPRSTSAGSFAARTRTSPRASFTGTPS